MYFNKIIFKNCANYNLFKKSKQINFPKSLLKYKELLEQASPLTEELFPRKVKDSKELSNYLLKDKLSPNLTITGKIPIDSINSGTFTPVWDLLDRGGKQWRPMLGLIIADFFKFNISDINKSKLLYRTLTLTELIHNASLIIDDVEDKSDQRRNQPCVHLKFGEDIAINAGISLLYFPIYKIIKEIDDTILRLNLAEAYFEEMVAIHLGQGWDIEMKVQNRIPTVDNYIDTVICKTGVCPRLMVKLIKILNKNESANIFKEFIDIIDNLSIAFQIRDDVLNISPSELSKGKGFLGEDIYEGKLTLMVLHTLNSTHSNSQKLKEILMMKTKDEKLIKEAIHILEVNGSIEYANDIMNKHMNLAKSKCETLAKEDISRFNTKAVEDLISLMDYLINRDK
jgi:geranylgeranyl pyrophosphate synthase